MLSTWRPNSSVALIGGESSLIISSDNSELNEISPLTTGSSATTEILRPLIRDVRPLQSVATTLRVADVPNAFKS